MTKKTLTLSLTILFILAVAGTALASYGFLSGEPGISYASLVPPPPPPEKGMWAVFTVGDTRYYSTTTGTEFWEYRPDLLDKYAIARERMSYERKADVAPFILNSRTFIPMRYLAYALGASDSDVIWDGAQRTAKLRIKTADETKTVEIVLKIGSNVLLNDGKPVAMDVAPVIRDGRTFLPARFVAEAAGYAVDWDETYRGVLVGPPGKLPVHPKRTTPVDGGVGYEIPGGEG
ncbi:MAG: copper amine oxidase N-terminal domain-containing protein [Bacillota bacterium]|jgi:hypothetical protein|nr:copper amine oxidase N-terminal domain-containing protein [Bacillota bacterium]